MKKNRNYILFCIVMLICTALVLIATLIYQLSSDNVFLTPFTNVMLIVFAVITALCLCIDNPNGQIFYKAGFYILHGGLVLLIIGFLISNMMTKNYTVSVLKDGNYYNSIRDGDNTVDLGFYFRFDDLNIEYYENENSESDNKSVKQYYAYLTVSYPDGKNEKIELSVNNPKLINGYRIYLMNVPTSGDIGATLLFKHDPAEATIYTGIAILIIGTFIMCYLGNVTAGKRKKASVYVKNNESEDNL